MVRGRLASTPWVEVIDAGEPVLVRTCVSTAPWPWHRSHVMCGRTAHGNRAAERAPRLGYLPDDVSQRRRGAKHSYYLSAGARSARRTRGRRYRCSESF
jgi:hypothetical protein